MKVCDSYTHNSFFYNVWRHKYPPYWVDVWENLIVLLCVRCTWHALFLGHTTNGGKVSIFRMIQTFCVGLHTFCRCVFEMQGIRNENVDKKRMLVFDWSSHAYIFVGTEVKFEVVPISPLPLNPCALLHEIPFRRWCISCKHVRFPNDVSRELLQGASSSTNGLKALLIVPCAWETREGARILRLVRLNYLSVWLFVEPRGLRWARL